MYTSNYNIIILSQQCFSKSNKFNNKTSLEVVHALIYRYLNKYIIFTNHKCIMIEDLPIEHKIIVCTYTLLNVPIHVV